MDNISNKRIDFCIYIFAHYLILVIFKNRRLFKSVLCTLEYDLYLQLKKPNLGSVSICLLVYASVALQGMKSVCKSVGLVF